MSNVVQVDFRNRVVPGVSSKPRPSPAAIGNLVFNLHAHNLTPVNLENPLVEFCTRLDRWKATVVVTSAQFRSGKPTTMVFWFEDDFITHSATAAFGEKIDPGKAERVEEV